MPPAPSHTRNAARERMIAAHLEAPGIRNPRVLEAMAEVPRETFLPAGTEKFAYQDSPLPIGATPRGTGSWCDPLRAAARARLAPSGAVGP
jgi:protein-L-isoaspartate(D-aspartate) O-methyltransferase